MISKLNADEEAHVVSFLDPVALTRVGSCSTHARSLAQRVMHGCSLGALCTHMNQRDLCATLGITPDEAKQLPFNVKERRGLAFLNVSYMFCMRDALPALLDMIGGWAELANRLQVVQVRKRKREDLEERRALAADRRCDRIDEWMANERPVGMQLSLDEWERSLARREARDMLKDATIREYVSDDVLKPKVTFEQVKVAIVAFEREQVAILRRKAEVRALLSNAGLPLDRELDVYKIQESLNWGVRPSRPDWTAAGVADRMIWETTNNEEVARIAAEHEAQLEAERAAQKAIDAERRERAKLLRSAARKRKANIIDISLFNTFVLHGHAYGMSTPKDIAESMFMLKPRRRWMDEALRSEGLDEQSLTSEERTIVQVYCNTGRLELDRRVEAVEVARHIVAGREALERVRRAERERAEARWRNAAHLNPSSLMYDPASPSATPFE